MDQNYIVITAVTAAKRIGEKIDPEEEMMSL